MNFDIMQNNRIAERLYNRLSFKTHVWAGIYQQSPG